MAGKLQFGIEMVGGDAIEAQLSRIVALQTQISTGFVVPQSQANQTIKSIEGVGNAVEETSKKITKMKGYGLADLPKLFSKSGFVVPDVSQQMAGMFKKGNSLAKFEAMERLSKQGGSEDLINQMAEMAKQDLATNKGLQKETSALSKQLEEWRRANPNGIAPDMKIHIPEIKESISDGKNPFQGEADAFGKGGLATKPELLNPSIIDHQKAIRLDAMEAKRQDMLQADRDKEKQAIERKGMQAKAIERRLDHDHAKFIKDMTFSMLPLLNAGSIWGTLFSSRQLFSAFMTEKGQGVIGKFGLSGVGGAAGAATALVTGLTAVGFALKGFGAIVSQVGRSFGDSLKLYSKSLMSGLGLGYTTQRSVAAGLLGVPENEILRFGTALAWLQPKIAETTSTLANNAIPLATLKIDWEIMKLKIEALASKIAVALKPELEKFISMIDSMVTSLSKSGLIESFGMVLIKIGEAMTVIGTEVAYEFQSAYKHLGLLMAEADLFWLKFGDDMKDIGKQIGQYMFDAITDALGSLGTYIKLQSANLGAQKQVNDQKDKDTLNENLGKMGMVGEGLKWFINNPQLLAASKQTNIEVVQDAIDNMTKDMASDNKEHFAKMKELLDKLFSVEKPDSGKGNLPPPLTMMKQLPVSAWERMGLVITGGHNQALDYSRRTANAVETIAHHIANMGGNSTVPRANQFNLDPRVTNP